MRSRWGGLGVWSRDVANKRWDNRPTKSLKKKCKFLWTSSKGNIRILWDILSMRCFLFF